MSRLNRTRTVVAVLTALVAALAMGCGDSSRPVKGADAAARGAESAAGDGDWLLRFTTAEGEDGEQSRAVYVRFNPTTGTAEARALPPVTASDASTDEQVLLVSADHAWAITDTAVPRADRRTGRLVVYSVTDQSTRTLDVRALSGKPSLRAVAWAFDPVDATVLRVVDTEGEVWKVDLAASSASLEGRLPKRAGWIFGNGFDPGTGRPYIESIDSDETEPAGNGDSDTRPVERQGGTLIAVDGEPLDGLPQPPCDVAAGFEYADGATWLFCADTPSISAYQAVKDGAAWHSFGTPSSGVVPKAAAELTYALPPAS